MQIGDIVRRAARRFGDAPAIVHGDRTMSFAEFDTATDRVGNALLASGLDAGDRVGVILPNGIEGLVAYYALAKAGLVRVSLNIRDTDDDHAERLRDSQARALITQGTPHPDVEAVYGIDDLQRMMADGAATPCDVSRDMEAPYRLGYTGGTTGPSKAVVLTMRGEHAEVTNYLLDLIPDVRPGDTMLHAAPVTHASGSFFLPHFMRGARNVLVDKFDPGPYLETLERYSATTTFLVPTMIAILLEEPNLSSVDTSTLRSLCYGASPISPSVAEQAQQAFGPILTQTYGQSEAPMTLTLLRADEHDRVGSAGRAYTMVEVRVFDEHDRELPRGEVGEIVARGQILMRGYWNRPEETAKTLRNGWLHTGDVGYVDEDGFVYLLDRRNDVIISGGFNVYPREVEDMLQAHPAVREAAVVSVPDDKWGEVVHAVVSTTDSVTENELLDFARGAMAGYKRPRSIHIWPEIPKNSAGKVLRRSVRDAVRSADGD